MLSRKVILTILVKAIILLANFGLVVFSTRAWGSDGRGEIALVIANISILSILANIFCGSTIAFHSGSIRRDFLLSISLAGAFLISFSGAFILSLILGSARFQPLFLITFFMSMSVAINSYLLGKNRIVLYNLMSLLGFLLIPVFLLIIYFIFENKTTESYFSAYYWGTGIALLTGTIIIFAKDRYVFPRFSMQDLKSVITYGFSNEFNYFLQFLNYRLSYFIIASMFGLGRLGIFSVVVSISEAVWIISHSLSTIHFSNVINSANYSESRNETKLFAKHSLAISVLLLIVAVSLPDSLYRFIFGEEFGEVSHYILLLIPGITAIAVSNIYGHYFAGTGKLKILRNKSLIGLAASILLLPVLVWKYELTGACISLNISYISSSVYLWIMFRKEMKKSGPPSN